VRAGIAIKIYKGSIGDGVKLRLVIKSNLNNFFGKLKSNSHSNL